MAAKSKIRKVNKKQREFIDQIIDAIHDIKGKSVVEIDLRELEAPTDFFIICQGDSSTQINAIGGNIKKVLKDEFGLLPKNFESPLDPTWVLVDYFDVVVHIFHPDTREFYNLETLWGDGNITEHEDLG